MRDAGYEPGTSAPEAWCASDEPPYLHILYTRRGKLYSIFKFVFCETALFALHISSLWKTALFAIHISSLWKTALFATHFLSLWKTARFVTHTILDVSFFCLRGTLVSLFTLSFTLLHNDPAAHQDHCERSRIRTRDLCPRSLVR